MIRYLDIVFSLVDWGIFYLWGLALHGIWRCLRAYEIWSLIVDGIDHFWCWLRSVGMTISTQLLLVNVVSEFWEEFFLFSFMPFMDARTWICKDLMHYILQDQIPLLGITQYYWSPSFWYPVGLLHLVSIYRTLRESCLTRLESNTIGGGPSVVVALNWGLLTMGTHSTCHILSEHYWYALGHPNNCSHI